MTRYLAQLQALLPRGMAWARDAGAILTNLLTAWSDELERVDGSAKSVIDEADPRTTVAMLDDWENAYGLPDPCVIEELSFEQRRRALVSLVTMRGGQTPQFFIDLAEAMSYVGATIQELKPFTCNDTCNDSLWSDAERFVWLMSLPADGGIVYFDCNGTCDSSLAVWGDESLECRVSRYKPAHTEVIFAYT